MVRLQSSSIFSPYIIIKDFVKNLDVNQSPNN